MAVSHESALIVDPAFVGLTPHPVAAVAAPPAAPSAPVWVADLPDFPYPDFAAFQAAAEQNAFTVRHDGTMVLHAFHRRLIRPLPRYQGQRRLITLLAWAPYILPLPLVVLTFPVFGWWALLFFVASYVGFTPDARQPRIFVLPALGALGIAVATGHPLIAWCAGVFILAAHAG